MNTSICIKCVKNDVCKIYTKDPEQRISGCIFFSRSPLEVLHSLKSEMDAKASRFGRIGEYWNGAFATIGVIDRKIDELEKIKKL